MINLEQAFRLDVDLAPPLDVQEAPQGYRRVIPITGGTFSGDRIDGVILRAARTGTWCAMMALSIFGRATR